MQIAAEESEPLIYDSSRRGSRALEELRGLLQYRDLVYQLVRRDIVTRYKRSVLGVAWTMLNPLGTMLVISVVFSQVFHMVQNYSGYLLTGVIAWTFFSQTTSASMTQMVWGGSMLRRTYIPRTVFVVSAIATGVVNFILALVPLSLILLQTTKTLHLTMLFLPVPMLMLAAFSLGVGLLLSSWAIYFPDVTEMYQVALTGWMYLTPIIWPVETIPEKYRFFLLNLNPMYYLIQNWRKPVFEGVLPSWPLFGAGVGIAVLALVVGWLVFSARADEFAYRA